ncbi:Cyclic di-GMP phosphodiesterase response regulator RpfG [Tautonia plasticadhaerens]|uniref:Cyclic di-GMP phosphodiesterase response regulator RpfG n=1 Tax=Tautonia plasticadhaerens TaxID=2527974 RepID=A0A518HBI0_9BACT|nr:Cyclic di-GMP phosphodiesterase response regulator RpfG [Tautonia plasticadhaerens]
MLIGARILADCRAASHLLPMVLYHHERFDGAGYPLGLRGEAIPLSARILAVADSYDAMRTSRVYRSALPPRQIEQILDRGRDGQWDGGVIDAFFRARDRIAAIYDQGEESTSCWSFEGVLRRVGVGGGADAGPPDPGVAADPASLIGPLPISPSLSTT